MIYINGKVGRALAALILAFAPAVMLADLAHASCVYPGQELAIAAAQQAETSSPVVAVIDTCGGDDTSYQVPLSVDITFDGQVFQDIYVTTNSVITFGAPDGTYWDYPQTPSISLYSMDWVVIPQYRSDEHLIISSSDGGFQVDISARPIWLQNAEYPTNIVITAAILSDGTVAMAYSVDGPTYDGQTRTGVRLNDGSIVNFEQYGIEKVEELPELAPEPTTESPFVPEPETISPTVSPESESPPLSSESETESPTISPETESPTVSPETESPTISPEPEVQDPNTIVLIVNEGEILSYVAPEGYKIDGIRSASYGTDNGCHAVDSQIIVESAVTSESFTISATNDIFGDPCPGTPKRLEIVIVIQELEQSNTESPSVSPEIYPEPEPTTTEEPQPTPEPVVTQTPEPQPTFTPTPEPVATQEPTVIPEPEPIQETEPVVSETPSPIPSPTVQPSPSLTPAPVPSETSKPIEPEQTESKPAPLITAVPIQSPDVVVTPKPSPSQTNPVPIPLPNPTETPNPIETEKPIAIISVEPEKVVSDLLNVDLSAETIAPEQIAEIRNAVEQVFSEVEKGSEEYNQALEALAVIAEADDPELPEELAAIPVLGAVAGEVLNVLNDLGNVGADMSPEQREKSEETVVAAVIVGQVAQLATAKAASAGISAAASTRRIK